MLPLMTCVAALLTAVSVTQAIPPVVLCLVV